MIKDIKFNGYTAMPSDYECPDGSLAASLNLISEDSQVKPLFQPKTKLLLSNRGKLLLIHKVPNQTNLIIQRGNNLYWMPEPSGDTAVSDSSATLIKQFDTINDIAIIGNTIAVASDSMEYLLWKDGAYTALGSKPPFINVEFGCKEVGTLDNAAELTVASRRGGTGGVYPATTEETSNAVFGLMLPAVAEITGRGYFYMPFFVRYAYRLYDGSYWWHSAPILMLPSVIIPQILVTGTETPEAGTLNVHTKLNIPYFQLNYKISGLGNLADWKDVVSAIDVFITAPIYTYNQSGKINYISTTRSQLLGGYYDYNPNNYDLRSGRVTIPDYIFSGHYAARGSNSYVDHKLSTAGSDSQTAWRVPANENFHEQIKSCNGGNFYKVASLSIDALDLMTDFKELPLSSSEMDNLVTRERLNDEYHSHHNIVAKTALTYNNRLCLTNLTMQPPVPFPLVSCVEVSSASQGGSPPANVQIEVFTRLNGVICHNINSDPFGNTWDMEGHYPRYIYYPDSSAYKMNFKYAGQDHFVDLVPHDFLNGAYYYGSLAENGKPTAFAAAETHTPATSIDLGNKIYVSEINNPFSFPPSCVVTVGNGVVLGLASAAKALSQGQFGQFPLYAFTTEGVWALEVSSTGTFSARQPISRDVCINPKSITPIDSSVLFATDRGIMLISGSETRCISDSIKNETPFDILTLPHMDSLHRTVHNFDDTCLPTQPFTEFISNCVMIYDYVHQHIFVGNPDYTYAYVFSLKSQMWGMIYSRISAGVPSYPYAYAMSQGINGNPYDMVVDFCNTINTSTAKGLLVTRPIKLEAPDVLKTIDTAIVRGNFDKGKVQTVLYGSRDLIHWHIVWSSKDHYLRGFRGTPYKYFRIACVTNLADGESLFGTTLQFSPRLTDQPR